MERALISLVFISAVLIIAALMGDLTQDKPSQALSAMAVQPPPGETGGSGEEADGPEDVTEGLTAAEGFFTVYSAPDSGKLIAALPAPDPQTGISLRMIYVPYLRTGLGSNPVGLDRGLGGQEQVLRFRVMAGQVFAEVENTAFRAETDNPAERRATEEAFARSVIWSGEVAETRKDGSVLVDLADFLTRDALGVARRLDARGQGSWRQAEDRSAIDPTQVLVFPDNVELEAVVTFTSDDPGSEVRAVAPEPEAVTLTLHHSFIRLPNDGYEMRRADPRAGIFVLSVADYAAALDKPIHQRYVVRHRLKKVTPGPEASPVEAPIVYYLDPGAPEPVRTALIEGAQWWAEAFEAAGFEDAYRVEVLPDDVHPLDARYNVINWVHRQTRGWSYGGSVVDPRTGEIIKGVVTLGSLRVRQDRMIFEGLLDAERTGSGGADDPVQLALARLKQLSAHEVGHTLGIAHNFAASTYRGRASVMDYPAPLVRVMGPSRLDLSEAYGEGLGAWDLHIVDYLYGELPEGADVDAALAAKIDAARAQGLHFVSDADARSVGSAHPKGSLWDNSPDPVDALGETLRVRQVALADFGLENIPDGAPVSDLRTVLVPIYLYHRYQVEAAAKLVGGLDFTYARKGDGRAQVAPVAADDQKRALALLIDTAGPGVLALPEDLVALLAPAHRNSADPMARERFGGRMGPQFDEAHAAAVAAGLTFDALLHPERLARLAAQAADDPAQPGVKGVLDGLSDEVLDFPAGETARLRRLRNAIADRYVTGLIDVAQDPGLPVDVAAEIDGALTGIAARFDTSGGIEDPRRRLADRIRRYLDRPAEPVTVIADVPNAPPGSPIGADPHGPAIWGHDGSDCWHCGPPF